MPPTERHIEATNVPTDWDTYGQTASKVLVPAIITATGTAVINYFRSMAERKRQQRELASSVQNIRDVIAPPEPDRDDIGTRVDRIQGALSAQNAILEERDHRLEKVEEGQARLEHRMDHMHSEAAQRHTELCSMILSLKRENGR